MVNLLAVLLLACVLLSATRAIAQEMEFRGASNGGNCVSCGWVAGEGEITADTPKRLLDFVSENYIPKNIVLNSPGGSVIGGIELGRLIREIGANTSVGDTRCLIPWFDGAIHSQEWKDAIWDRYVTAAPRPRTLSEQQYSDRKLQPRS